MNLRSGLRVRGCGVFGIWVLLLSCLPADGQGTRRQPPKRRPPASLQDFFDTKAAPSQPASRPRGLSAEAADAFGSALSRDLSSRGSAPAQRGEADGSANPPELAPIVSAADATRHRFKPQPTSPLALPADAAVGRGSRMARGHDRPLVGQASRASIGRSSAGSVIQVAGYEELPNLPSLEPATTEGGAVTKRNDPPPPLAFDFPMPNMGHADDTPEPSLPTLALPQEPLQPLPLAKPSFTHERAAPPAPRTPKPTQTYAPRAVDLTPESKHPAQRAHVSPLLTPQPLAPQPLTPQPLTPQPLTPQPQTPQPLTPQSPGRPKQADRTGPLVMETKPTQLTLPKNKTALIPSPRQSDTFVEEVVDGVIEEVQSIDHAVENVAMDAPRRASRVVDAAPNVTPTQFVPDQPAPFEVIGESGRLELQMGRSKLLRMKVDVYRAAVVDPRVCDIVQYTAREVAVIGKGHGSTHVTFWFDGTTGPMTYLVRVSPNQSVREDVENEYQVLERILAEHFPDSKVRLHPVADKLFVKGEAKDSSEAAQILAIIRSHAGAGAAGGNANGGGTMNAGAAARVFALGEAGDQQRPAIQVINMLRVPGVQQVALRVKIAELNRTAARGFGVDANTRIEFKTDRAGLLVQSLLNASGGNAPALLANFDGTDIQLGLRTLQSHGVLRLLSEPTLVTLSGQPATFVAGGEFAVPTLVANGGGAVTTDFRAFGAIISFLPTVVDKDRIRLQVAPEFSQINSNLTVGGTPGLNVRAVSTTVEMREGQTLAIAGLLDDNMQASSASNLPILKSILGGRDVSRTETELLILVTPELVSPMEPEETPPLPGFDVTEPTDKQFYWKGRLEGNPTWDHRSTVWPRLKRRYGAGGPAMISGPFGHGP